MSAWEALLLGLLQGATEFLPVSSSGHLVIGQLLLDLQLPGVVFEVVVHLATLVSVLVVYRGRAGWIVRGSLAGRREELGYLGLLLVASVPAGLVGVLFQDAAGALFDRPPVVGVALLVTGALLWSSRWALSSTEETAPAEAAVSPVVGEERLRPPDRDRLPGPMVALWIGVAQAVAIVPGISRSGATVVTGLWLRVDPEEAAAFSFLMSVPAIGGAALLSAIDLVGEPVAFPWVAATVGAVAAALAGVVAIRTFVAMLRRRAFHHFAPYCWLVGSAFLVYLSLR